MKISELTLPQLDAWVARAEETPFVMRHGFPCREEEFDPEIHCHESSTKEWKCWTRLQYSSDWGYGGPIIEREKIGTNTWTGDWCAQFTLPVRHPTNPKRDPSHHCMRGETPLIAAMRTYVASRFGDEVSEE